MWLRNNISFSSRKVVSAYKAQSFQIPWKNNVHTDISKIKFKKIINYIAISFVSVYQLKYIKDNINLRKIMLNFI